MSAEQPDDAQRLINAAQEIAEVEVDLRQSDDAEDRVLAATLRQVEDLLLELSCSLVDREHLQDELLPNGYRVDDDTLRTDGGRPSADVPRGAEDAAIDMRPSGPAGTLLFATPRGRDVTEAEDRGEWLVGRGIEVRQ